MKIIALLILCSIFCKTYGKSLSLLLKERQGETPSSVDHIMNTKDEDQGMFGFIGENLTHLQDMVYDVNNQMKSMMESGGVPILQQTIDTMRLWQRQANRFTKSLGFMFG